MDAPSATSRDSPRAGSARRRVALRIVGAAYLAFVAGVVFWPTPVDRPAAGTLAHMFVWLHRHGVPLWFGYNLFEWLANVAFFVPFGVLAVLFGSRVRWAVVAACSVSTAVELSQWLFLPQRTGSVLDVLANTSGAFIGAGLAALWTRRPRRSL
ncbi:VanZ family protein [Sinomonas terrae]|uniref:VanZ family protein n=1 Tax=Sinomonas terrae TaxID=2908838 RepID=A0ABS9U2Y6_9MICC|nr:VanZ family protein [Sinomonas terrae]MCH6471066.1 VanZ family protein [Sinomonas terrae]